jgi:transcription initiation factor TFIIB
MEKYERLINEAWQLLDGLSVKTNDPDEGPRCGKCGRPLEERDRAEGYRVCPSCGKVAEIYIDDKAEWRTHVDAHTGIKGGQARCGPAPGILFPKSSMSTTIAGPANSRLQRTHQWNSMTSSERSLHQTMKYYENLEAQYKLGGQVTATATEIFSALASMIDAYRSGTKRNNNKQSLQAACLYFACRRVGCPRNRREISTMTGVPLKFVTKGINMFVDIMDGDYVSDEPLRAQDFAARYCSALDLPFSLQKQLLALLGALDEMGLQFGVSPCSVCCGALYFLCQLTGRKVTREAIHETCGSSVAVMGKVHSVLAPLTDEFRRRLDIGVDH